MSSFSSVDPSSLPISSLSIPSSLLNSSQQSVYQSLLFDLDGIIRYDFNRHDGIQTKTWQEQREVEDSVKAIIDKWISKNLMVALQEGEKRMDEELEDDDDNDNDDNDDDADEPSSRPNISSASSDQSTTASTNRLYSSIHFHRSDHIVYCLRGLTGLPYGYVSLDASRMWIVYWIIHSLDLLGHTLSLPMARRILDWINRCQSLPGGGYGGGPQQLPHLAPSYAAINAIIILSKVPGITIEESLGKINRIAMYRFLSSLKDTGGGFHVCAEGEIDTRGAYCALSVASVLNIIDDQLIKGTADWIASCQTYEGGIGGEPGNEAHGGYAFCGLASLILLKQTQKLDLKRLLHWATHRQTSYEGGFQGRTNKLVDGCYSFWVGALFPLIDLIASQNKPNSSSSSSTSSSDSNNNNNNINNTNTTTTTTTTTTNNNTDTRFELGSGSSWLFHQLSLEKYIHLNCEMAMGGLRDKPGKHPDYYHTCYCLSGLSIAQNTSKEGAEILGLSSNILKIVNPIYNVESEKLSYALQYFYSESRPQVNRGIIDQMDEKKSTSSSSSSS